MDLQTPWAAHTRDGQDTLILGSPVTGTLQNGQSLSYHITLNNATNALALRYDTGVEGALPLEVDLVTANGASMVGTISNDMAEKYLYLPALPPGDVLYRAQRIITRRSAR